MGVFISIFGWFVLHWRLECYLHLALGHLFPYEDCDFGYLGSLRADIDIRIGMHDARPQTRSDR
jgi:hypothetical protein